MPVVTITITDGLPSPPAVITIPALTSAVTAAALASAVGLPVLGRDALTIRQALDRIIVGTRRGHREQVARRTSEDVLRVEIDRIRGEEPNPADQGGPR